MPSLSASPSCENKNESLHTSTLKTVKCYMTSDRGYKSLLFICIASVKMWLKVQRKFHVGWEIASSLLRILRWHEWDEGRKVWFKVHFLRKYTEALGCDVKKAVLFLKTTSSSITALTLLCMCLGETEVGWGRGTQVWNGEPQCTPMGSWDATGNGWTSKQVIGMTDPFWKNCGER